MEIKKLTSEQKTLLDSLTAEFIALNNRVIPSNGLIDISGILAKIEREQNFESEYNTIVKGVTIRKHEQRISDIELLRGDLAQLGLGIKMSDNGNAFYIYIEKLGLDVCKSDGRDNATIMSFSYRSSHYSIFKRDEFERRYDSQFVIHGNLTSYHDGESYIDIHALINSELFKNALGRMYKITLKL